MAAVGAFERRAHRGERLLGVAEEEAAVVEQARQNVVDVQIAFGDADDEISEVAARDGAGMIAMVANSAAFWQRLQTSRSGIPSNSRRRKELC